MEQLVDECLILSIGDYACMSFLEALSLPITWRIRLLERIQEIKDEAKAQLPPETGSRGRR